MMFERVRWIFGRRARDRQMRAELEAHIQTEIDELVEAGVPPDEAEGRARTLFGNQGLIKEELRAYWRIPIFDDLALDVKYAVRQIRRHPILAGVVVVTLALAIGANTAIFSIVHAVLVRPLPYPEADRLVHVYTRQVERETRGQSSIPDYLEWKQRATSFEAMETFQIDMLVMEGTPDSRIRVLRTDPGFLDLLGVSPATGRLISEDDRRSGPPVVVLSHDLWMSRFGGDPGVVGRPIRLGESRFDSIAFKEEVDFALYTVIGVAQPVRGPLPGDFGAVIPWNAEDDPGRDDRNRRILPVVGRLRPAVTPAAAEAELEEIRIRLEAEFPEVSASRSVVVSLEDSTLGEVRPALIALFGATGLLLLIGVSNIANILLARGSARQPEFSMRAAFGASRMRLARLLTTEAVLLTLIGGALGIGLGYLGLGVIVALEPGWIPRLNEVRLHATVLTAASGVALLSGLLFGLLPVLFVRTNGASRAGRIVSGDMTGRSAWARSGLIVSQLALSFVLLSGAGLMIRSFNALRAVPIGFDHHQTVTFSLGGNAFGGGPFGPSRQARLQEYREVVEMVRAVPGVLEVTLTSQPPLDISGVSYSVNLVSGLRNGESHAPVGMVGVAENFFEFFGAVPVAGRLFDSGDGARPDDAVVVDTEMAALIWPDESAVGQRIRLGEVESEVIGVVQPIRYAGLEDEARPKLFHPLGRTGVGIFGNTVLARHEGGAAAILAGVQERLEQEVDDSLAPQGLRSLEDVYDAYLREPRFYLLLLGGLGLLGLAVAGVGVYGVIAYSVERRTAEIGIRMALGADWTRVVGLFCRRTMALLGVGLAVGFLGAAWLTRYLESLLFEVDAVDAVAWTSMAVVLGATALLATLIPMRRAVRIDPATALRPE